MIHTLSYPPAKDATPEQIKGLLGEMAQAVHAHGRDAGVILFVGPDFCHTIQLYVAKLLAGSPMQYYKFNGEGPSVGVSGLDAIRMDNVTFYLAHGKVSDSQFEAARSRTLGYLLPISEPLVEALTAYAPQINEYNSLGFLKLAYLKLQPA